MKYAFVVGGVLSVGLALARGSAPTAASKPSMIALDQGWSAAQAQTFHYTPQGTETMPAAWLRSLRLPDGTLVMQPSNLQRLGFQDVHAKASVNNRYGWPIGFTVDRVDGIEAAGLTCAACHTGQLQYNGVTMRVEGGSSNIDVGAFDMQLRNAIRAIKSNASVRERFMKDAVANGYPKARLAGDFNTQSANPDMWLVYSGGRGGTSAVGGPGRVDALTGIANRLFSYDIGDPNNAIRGIAPTSFPPLWDIWRFDWVEYNGSVRVPMARNVGESLGVGVRTHIINVSGELNPEPRRWTSSLRVHNLYAIEQELANLKPPAWPAAVMGAVDPAQAKLGRALFDQKCAACHRISRIAGTAPTEWAVRVIPYARIGTDPNEVLMFAGSRFDGSKLGWGKNVPGPVGIGKMVGGFLEHAYKAAGITTPAAVAKFNGWGREGYVTAPCGYKPRPLIGIWATPPFLHNGSVPSIYDLLSETRPTYPILGNPEYDPAKLGTVQRSDAETMTLDTTKLGNSNAGHWFTNDKARPGRIGPALSETQKFAILAYLKIANYANYPTIDVSHPYPLPCDKDFNWADGKVPDLHMNAR